MLSDLLNNPRFSLLGALLIMQLVCTPSASGLDRIPLAYREILLGISKISLGITMMALTFLVVKVLLKGWQPT